MALLDEMYELVEVNESVVGCGIASDKKAEFALTGLYYKHPDTPAPELLYTLVNKHFGKLDKPLTKYLKFTANYQESERGKFLNVTLIKDQERYYRDYEYLPPDYLCKNKGGYRGPMTEFAEELKMHLPGTFDIQIRVRELIKSIEF